MKHNLAILTSGSGSTMAAIVDAVRAGNLPGIKPVVVISSRTTAPGIEKARERGIPVEVVRRKDFVNEAAFGDKLLEVCRRYQVTLVSQNGWLPLTPGNLIAQYTGRIINQHPGPLDPEHGHDFGGGGMYGRRVLAARILYCWYTGSDYWTEATTHQVTAGFDEGGVLCRTQVPVPALTVQKPVSADLGVSAEIQVNREAVVSAVAELQKALLPVEHQAVIETLAAFGAGREVPVQTRSTPLVAPAQYSILNAVKQLAIQLYPHG
jgi:folate-dependent phosphoribosylglycinamide formyltransferase PurN